MKFARILALILAVCMMSCVFVACDSGDEGGTAAETSAPDETTDGTTDGTGSASSSGKVRLTVKLIIKGGKKDIEQMMPYGGEDALLSSVIDFYNEIFNDSTESCFNSAGILTKIGNLEGDWTAYDEAKGSSAGKIPSIADFVVEDGMTIVLTCKPLTTTPTETE